MVFALFASSCVNSPDANKQNLVTYVKKDTAQYCGINYYRLSRNIFGLSSYNEQQLKDNGFSLISWHYNFPFTGLASFYSYSDYNPNYIVQLHSVNDIWLREDYDYKKDIFIIEGTSAKFPFEEILTENATDAFYRNYNPQKICLYSESSEPLFIEAYVFFLNGDCYIHIPNMDIYSKSYQVSERFLSTLLKDGIIS